jgi:hypothetical protein
MSSPVLIAVSKFVRDLLVVDEQLIRIGRHDFDRDDMDKQFIVIDALGPHVRTASLESYDGTAETLGIGAIWEGPVTLDFYGAGAYTRAIDFSLRTQSQAARELRRALGVTIYQPASITDVKALTGSEFSERVQVTTTVAISSNISIDTLRIDTAQLEIRTEDGIQFDG